MSKATYLSHPVLWQQLPVFFQPWWLDIVSKRWDMAVTEEQGRVTGVLPYCSDRRMGLTIIRNPVLTPYLGPFLLYPGNMAEADQASWKEAALSRLWQQLPRWDSFDMETTTDFAETHFLQEKDFHLQNKITYETDLTRTEEELWAAMHKNHRHLIRQAMPVHKVDEGLQHLPALLRLHEATFTRKQKRYTFPASLIENLVRTSIQKNAGNMLTTVDDKGRATACIFTVWDHEKMYLLLSATDPALAHQGAVRLLIWQAIQQAKSKGLRIFDFEGSMDPGIGAFFRRFGGEQKTYLCASRNKSVLWKIKKTLLG